MKPNRNRLYPFKLNIFKIDENYNWKQQNHDIAIKLIGANALLFLIRNHVNKYILRTIYIMLILYGGKTCML